MKINKVSSFLSPLCYLPNGDLICYKFGYLYTLRNGKIIRSDKIFDTFKERILGRIRIINRLLRLGVRAALAIDNDRILISADNTIYEYSFSTAKLSNGFILPKGIRPLTFSEIKGISGFEDCIVFGGYFSNVPKNPVNIYKRVGIDNWIIAYTFPKGEINHIHNIISDRYRDCIWVFSGDFDDASAIFKITNGFQKVERIFYGSQDYRACVIFATPQGLLYATDAPFRKNSIYLLSIENINGNERYFFNSICEISGSCIYGCQIMDKYCFATSVEPDERQNFWYNMLINYKLGAGVKDRYSHLFFGDDINGFSEIYKLKKDMLPFIFRYGAVCFPSGTNNSSTMYFQPIATKNDLVLMAFNLK